MAYNDNVVFKTSTTATIDDLFTWNKSTGQITAKTDNIPIVPGTVYFTSDGHIVHDVAQNNRLWMSKNAYSAIYAEDVAETNTDIANAIKYSIHYVEGPTTDTTPGTWTGTINGITKLYDGLTIIYVPAVAGGSSTTTLNINGLGAKTCYYSNTSAMTTHYSVGTPILLTYRNNCWRRADYNSNTTYSAMSVAEMRTGTATSERSIRADYLKTFLSTLGGTNLTLTHSKSAPYLQLNHDPSGITAGTYGNNSQQTPSYGGTFNIPYFTVDAQGHITNASTTTVKIPASDNTDYKVRQTPINSNDNNNYRILLSNSANDTPEDNVSKKYINLQYNPSTNKVTTGNLDLTGNLQISGNATLNNNTNIENAIINSLLVNGNSNFVNNVNFSQIPTAPTAIAGDNTTKLATTAFVATALGAYLPLIGGTMVNTASNRASIIFPAFNGAVGGQSNLSINGATTGDDTADNRANITITAYQNKRKTIYGSSGITIDNTAESTGWASNFVQIRYVDTSDNLKKTFAALGFKGTIDQLDYIYMGGTYTNPAMKLTPNNTFTFNTNVILTDSQTSSTVGSSLLKIYNSGTHAVGLELQRNSGASWQIVNESGTFIIRQNYTSGSAQTTYNTNTQLSIAHNTGNVIIGGELSAGKTTDTTTKKITTRNSYGSISLTMGSSNGIGARGLYDNTFSRWLIYFSPDETNNTFANGKVYIPKWGGVGSSSQPVYFNSNGEPIAITGSLANDITGNAATATNLSGTKTANYIYAGPSSGNAAAPTFRALVINDIPNLPGSKITSGTISADRLPKASSSAFGIIKSGTGLSIDNGVASVNLSDLGLSSAMHFIGISSTSISQGGNQNPTIDNNEISVKQNGDVVLWNTQEFVWNGSSWQLLGDENSYKIKQTSVSDPTVVSNATAISFISNITQDTNGVITATKKDLQVASTSEPGITQYTADNLNTWLNQLTLGSSDPQDNDYYISQYSNGGTTYTSRRPMSKLWNYIRGKADNRYSQTDTKNTAGSTSTNDKIYIIGAKEQSANPQTYSADSTVYISNKSIYANNFIGTAKQSYGLIGITSITNTSGLYFYKGSITNNDPNSTDYTKWSCPNHIANTTAGTNSLILRLLWGNNYFKDIYMSPNSNKILYRQVFESNRTPIAGEWRYIVQSSTDGVGDANTPIYITNSGNATAITGAIANDTTGNAATATQTKFLMNRGGSTVTIQDNIWNHNQTPFNHTNAATVWHQRWKQSGLTYTPLGGDTTAITDSGDLVYWLSAGNTSNVLFLNMAIDGMIYAGGGFKGDLNGTATNATQLISNDRMDYGWDGINYFNISTSNQSAAKVNDTPFSSNVWTHILRFNHNNASGYYTDLAIPFSQNSIYYKRIAAGSLQNSTTNGGWIEVLDQLNYTSYTVTKTGSGASGTWNINISGNAATASKLSNTSKIGDTNKPVYFKADGTPAAINYTIDKAVPSNAVFTDRYVNSATFADDSTNTAASPVKMTLIRAGSDTATVTASIPKVSSSSAGVAPKGAAVSSQNQSTKFLREDGTWAAPSYTVNTNTDTLVKQTAKSDNKNYKILFTTSDSPTSGNANEAAYDTGITINPSTHTLTATKFIGSLQGNAATASRATADANGNIITSTYKTKQTAVSDPAANGTSISFISSITQDANGNITATKATIPTVSKTTNGLVPQLPNETTTTKFLRQDGSWVVVAAAKSTTLTRDTETTIATIGGNAIKIKLPPSDNTDEKVKQATSTDNAYRKVLVSGGATYLINDNASERTDSVYQTSGVMVQPSSGKLVANSFETNTIPSNVGLQFCRGQITIQEGTEETLPAGQPFYGNSNRYDLWSYPPTSSAGPSTAVNSESGLVNIMNLRLAFNSTCFKDIFMSPNNHRIYTRSVNHTADSWKLILRSDIEGAGSITQPVYISNEGVAKPVNALPVNQNLLTNTQYYFNNNTSTKPIKKISTQDIPMSDCYSKYDIASGTGVTDLNLGTFAPAPDTWYTLSFYAKANYNNITIRTHFYPNTTASSYNCQGFSTTAGDGSSNFTVSTEWKRYWVCYKTSASVSGTKNFIARLISGTSPGTTLRVALPKLEVGQIMTPWVPHANDFSQNKISTCYIDNHELNNYQWHRIATCSVGTTNYDDRDIILFVHKGYLANAFGILKISVRVDTNAVSPPIKLQAKWLLRHGFSESDCLIGLTRNLIDASSAATADIYFKTSTTYARIAFTALNNFNKRFTLFNSDEIAKTENGVKITDLANSTEVYIKENIMNGTTVESIKFKSDASSDTGITYVSWEYASDSLSEKSLIPIANNTYDLGSSSLKWNNVYANNLKGNADTATKATQDANGNNIINTYLTKTAGVTNITWDNTNKKLIKTINNSNSDIVTLYAANLKLNNTAVYNTELEIKNIKIGNGSTSTSTKNVKLEYNETLETLNFVFS